MSIKQSVKKWFRFLQRRPRRGGGELISPRRDWLWTLALAFSILVFGATALVYNFFALQSAVLEDVSVETTLIRYRQADVNHFLTEMEVRTKAHTALRAERHAPPPSTLSTTTPPVLSATASTSSPVEESGAM